MASPQKPGFTTGAMKKRRRYRASRRVETTPRSRPLGCGVAACGVRARRSQSPQNLQGTQAGRGGVPRRRNERGIPGTGSGEAAFALLSAMLEVPTHVPAVPAVPGQLHLADSLGDVPGATSELPWAAGADAHGRRAVAAGESGPRPKAGDRVVVAAAPRPGESPLAAGLPGVWS